MLENMGKPGEVRILVCCGSGGVGKTTLAVAIGLYGAVSGLKTIVLTSNPARRLADLLEIGEFRGSMGEVSLDLGNDHHGELHVLTVDAKRTFDQLIGRYAKRDKQQRIFSNRYYQHLSENMGGTHEYMAMEKLYEIHMQKKWDLIVLDTPPSQRALDFLDAPERVLSLLGHQYLMKFINPKSRGGIFGSRMFGFVSNPVYKAVSHVIGKQVLDDLFEFFTLFNDILLDEFQKRAKAVQSLLSDPVTGFILITTPHAYPMQESSYLYKRLKEQDMTLQGVIINRVHTLNGSDDAADVFEAFAAGNLISPDIIRQLEMSYARFYKLAKSDDEKIKQFHRTIEPKVPVVKIPVKSFEVFNIKGLMKLHRHFEI